MESEANKTKRFESNKQMFSKRFDWRGYGDIFAVCARHRST